MVPSTSSVPEEKLAAPTETIAPLSIFIEPSPIFPNTASIGSVIEAEISRLDAGIGARSDLDRGPSRGDLQFIRVGPGQEVAGVIADDDRAGIDQPLRPRARNVDLLGRCRCSGRGKLRWRFAARRPVSFGPLR